MNVRRRTPPWLHYLAATVLFSLLSLWCMRSVLDAPATAVNFKPAARSGALAGELAGSDLRRGIAQSSYAARALASDPLSFSDGGMCYPSADSVAFGEHMLGEGVQGLPAHLIWNDPLITHNFVVTLKPVIAALGMYAFAYHWTGSAVAALLAGFLFGFHALRLSDLVHPSVRANEWIPWILLLLDRLFAHRRWRDALLLAIVSALQLLESMYVLAHYATIASLYGAHLLLRHRGALPALLPQLAVVAAALVAVAAWVFHPYLEVRATWGILEKRGFWNVHAFYPGTCLLLLAFLGLVDRLRGTSGERRHDPRIVLTLAALLLVWFVQPLRVPLTDLVIPRLAILVRGWVPGIDAIRAPHNISFGVAVCLGLLAAYGVRSLTVALGPRARVVVLTLVTLACVAENFLPAWSRASFRAVVPSAAFALRPPEDDLRAVRDLPSGPVLDYPGNYSYLWVGHLSRYVLLGAYHQRRISTCKSSFVTPVQYAVNAISADLPSADAATELWALGFRTILFHAQDVPRIRAKTDEILAALADPAAGAHLVPLSTGSTVRAARLVAGGPVSTDVATLVPAGGDRLPRPAGATGLVFGVRSEGATFRHPDPIRPTELVVEWRRGDEIVHTQKVRRLLPLAVAAERTIDIKLHGARIVGTPGIDYEVTLATTDDPPRILGRETILVVTDEAVPPGDGEAGPPGDGGD